jgi:hypothetical protein
MMLLGGLIFFFFFRSPANAHPMNSEELLTKQAEMVLAADPGLEGYAPRVWVYRNTIKALNWSLQKEN